MKEDKEKSLVVCNFEVSFLHSDDNPANKIEGKNEIKEPVLLSSNEEKLMLEQKVITDENSTEDLATHNIISAEPELTETDSKSMAINNADDCKVESNENLISTELNLRPRKTETVQNAEEDSKAKKSKNGCRKTEKKCAIKKEDNLLNNEYSKLNYTETSVKLTSDLSALRKENSEVIDVKNESLEVKLEPVVTVQNFIATPENEVNGVENLPLIKLHEENSSVSKENSESDTRISSASENSILKIPKKRRRRREVWWTKRRKRTEGHQHKNNTNNSPVAVGFQWRDATNAGSLPNEITISNKRKSSEGNENVQKKPREFAIPSPSLADISMKAAIPESTATSIEARIFLFLPKCNL